MQCAKAVIGDLSRPRNMSAALEGVHAVIHSAGFTQGMSGVPDHINRPSTTNVHAHALTLLRQLQGSSVGYDITNNLDRPHSLT